MGWVAKDLPSFIFLLLPGFISAGIFYTLTAHPKTTEFERLIQSLIFTGIIKVATYPVRFVMGLLYNRFPWGTWNADVDYVWSFLLAIFIGFAFSYSTNKDLFHGLARNRGWSTRTSFPSEWYSAFDLNSTEKRYLILSLKGSRRLKGWAEEWPDQPDKGHFIITKPEWILDDNQFAPLFQVERFLIPATEVEMVEFLKSPEEITATPEEIMRVEK